MAASQIIQEVTTSSAFATQIPRTSIPHTKQQKVKIKIVTVHVCNEQGPNYAITVANPEVSLVIMSFAGMRILRGKYLVMCVFTALLPYIVYVLRPRNSSHKNVQHHKIDTFVSALTARADADRYVMLVMTDVAFLDMAVNFYEASLRAHHVDNFLFVGIGRKTCDILCTLSVPCFYYADDSMSGNASYYGERDFLRKMNYRTDMILQALEANFTVIHTDADVAFFGNPLSDMKVTLCILFHKFVNEIYL